MYDLYTDLAFVVVLDHKQVQIGSHVFTFDYVFGSGGYASSRIFDECVAPLVDALFQGYNGTVLAYGQVRCQYFCSFLVHFLICLNFFCFYVALLFHLVYVLELNVPF